MNNRALIRYHKLYLKKLYTIEITILHEQELSKSLYEYHMKYLIIVLKIINDHHTVKIHTEYLSVPLLKSK